MLLLKFKSNVLGFIVHDQNSLDEFYSVREEFKSENPAYGVSSFSYAEPFTYSISPLGQYPVRTD